MANIAAEEKRFGSSAAATSEIPGDGRLIERIVELCASGSARLDVRTFERAGSSGRTASLLESVGDLVAEHGDGTAGSSISVSLTESNAGEPNCSSRSSRSPSIRVAVVPGGGWLRFAERVDRQLRSVAARTARLLALLRRGRRQAAELTRRKRALVRADRLRARFTIGYCLLLRRRSTVAPVAMVAVAATLHGNLRLDEKWTGFRSGCRRRNHERVSETNASDLLVRQAEPDRHSERRRSAHVRLNHHVFAMNSNNNNTGRQDNTTATQFACARSYSNERCKIFAQHTTPPDEAQIQLLLPSLAYVTARRPGKSSLLSTKIGHANAFLCFARL
ncbi:hypothetical protein T10_12093 [Trichinella papuae]|uniref:Uncharacterized protein n=1 Tax=Trichinella papuae TaxID=268474 RepID=A0A0V1M4E3_9BILA|nr:hypothetical protein T10_12093 [Trichinella papuae]